MKYELEVHRVYALYTSEDTWDVVKQSDDRKELTKLADSVRLKSGKTFYEKLALNTLDENGDIQDVEILKETAWK